MADVYVDVSRVIGSVEVVAQEASVKTRVSVSRVIGAVSPLVAKEEEVRVAISPVVGAVRLGVRPLGSLWIDLNLPCIMQDQYQFSNMPGLVRTMMERGQIRQRIRWLNHPRALTVTVTLNLQQMVDLETLAGEVGAAVWNLPLTTGDGRAELHAVRFTGPVTFLAVYNFQYEAILPLEAL